VRFWNVRHPAAYAQRIAAGASPALGREVLDDETRRVERILLETRLAEGLPVDVLDAEGRARLPALRDDGLVEERQDRVVLTLRGRLLADAVVRDLVP
jgi:oxygen-independent coproporphyrinogen-3 oxidase